MAETFDINPAYALPEDDLQRGHQTKAQDGPVHRHRVWNVKLRKWNVSLADMQLAHVTRLRDLWTLTKGGALRMLWTPPGGSQIDVHFANSELVIEQQSAVFFQSKVILEEVRVSP